MTLIYNLKRENTMTSSYEVLDRLVENASEAAIIRDHLGECLKEEKTKMKNLHPISLFQKAVTASEIAAAVIPYPNPILVAPATAFEGLSPLAATAAATAVSGLLTAASATALAGAKATVAGIVSSSVLAPFWGAARLSYEVVHQVRNSGDANIGNNFTNSMNDLMKLEKEELFPVNFEAIHVLKELETRVITEGNKPKPDLNKMQENLFLTKILRESILKHSGISPQKNQELYEKSNKVVDNFKAWAKIEQGRTNPFVALVSDVANVAAPQVEIDKLKTPETTPKTMPRRERARSN